jgi:hypothetical protein
VISEISVTEKPVWEKVTLYPELGGRFKNLYEPRLSVVWVNVTPVDGFESVTATPEITAPVASVTTPVMDAVSCALIVWAETSRANNNRNNLANGFRMRIELLRSGSLEPEGSCWKLLDPRILLRISGGEGSDLQVKYNNDRIERRSSNVQPHLFAVHGATRQPIRDSVVIPTM